MTPSAAAPTPPAPPAGGDGAVPTPPAAPAAAEARPAAALPEGARTTPLRGVASKIVENMEALALHPDGHQRAPRPGAGDGREPAAPQPPPAGRRGRQGLVHAPDRLRHRRGHRRGAVDGSALPHRRDGRPGARRPRGRGLRAGHRTSSARAGGSCSCPTSSAPRRSRSPSSSAPTTTSSSARATSKLEVDDFQRTTAHADQPRHGRHRDERAAPDAGAGPHRRRRRDRLPARVRGAVAEGARRGSASAR